MDDLQLEFCEAFAFGEDRRAILHETGIPGTAEHYFYSGLLALHNHDTKAAAEVLAAMEIHFGGKSKMPSKLWDELRLRVHLAEWDAGETEKAASYLKEELNLNFDAEQELLPGASYASKAPLPMSLPAEKASSDFLLAAAFKEDGTLWESALKWAGQHLKREECKELLKVMERPDFPGLEELLIEVYRNSTVMHFGSRFPVERHLTLKQLEAIRAALPYIGRVPGFLQVFARKLLPSSSDVDKHNEDQTCKMYMDRLEEHGLLVASPSLRARVLYERMCIGQRAGTYDAALLEEFLGVAQYARNLSTGVDRYVRLTTTIHDDGVDATPLRAGDPSHTHEPLIHDFFLNIFSQPDGSQSTDPVQEHLAKWLPFTERKILSWEYLAALLGEAKLLAGEPGTQWYDLLRKAYNLKEVGNEEEGLQAFIQRVDVEFLPTNPRVWRADDEVAIDVRIKNVPELTIKVFEISMLKYFQDKEDDNVSQAINLDGLTATYEATLAFSDMAEGQGTPFSAARRLHYRLRLPHLDHRRGCFVAELIGNGIASRAIIRKGNLRIIERTSVAGHALQIVREDGTQVGSDAFAWVNGKQYVANGSGEVLVPFASENEARKRILLSEGGLTVVGHFDQRKEEFTLRAAMWLDEGSLCAGQQVRILVHPTLTLGNDRSVSISLLQQPALQIQWHSPDSLLASHTVSDICLSDTSDFVHTVRVPERALRLQIGLHGKAGVASQGGSEVALASEEKAWDVAQSSKRGHQGDILVEGLYLARDSRGFRLLVLGHNGEKKAGREVAVRLQHRFARNMCTTATHLQTDADGACQLGALSEVCRIRAELVQLQVTQSWALWEAECAQRPPGVQYCREGDVFRLAYNTSSELGVASISLFATNLAGLYTADMTQDHMARLEGGLELRSLPAGEYKLSVPTWNQTLTVRVVGDPQRRDSGAAPAMAAPSQHGPEPQEDTDSDNNDDTPFRSSDYVATGPTRMAEISNPRPLAIIGVREVTPVSGAAVLTVQLAGADPASTRVHVVFSHLVPPSGDEIGPYLGKWGPIHVLGKWEPVEVPVEQARSNYLSSRQLSDEVRYVLDRRQKRRRSNPVGNLLPRPSLLVKPRAVKTTTTSKEHLKHGDALPQNDFMNASRPTKQPCFASQSLPKHGRGAHSTSKVFALAFCPPSLAVTNLRADARGIVEIPLSAVPASNTFVRIVAIDDLQGRQVASIDYALGPAEPNASVFYRDVALRQGLDPGYGYSEQRTAVVLSPAESAEVGDAGAQLQMYDTLEKAHFLFESLLEEGGRRSWQEFAFVKEWPTLSTTLKQKKAAKYSSHELHLFLYFKDPEFFTEHVVPALRCKLERDFLTNWLLENTTEVLEWSRNLQLYGSLNAAERCLLASTLAQNGHAERAEAVATDVENWSKSRPADASPLGRHSDPFTTALAGGVLGDLSGEGSGILGASEGVPDGPAAAVQMEMEEMEDARVGERGEEDEEEDWETIDLPEAMGPVFGASLARQQMGDMRLHHGPRTAPIMELSEPTPPQQRQQQPLQLPQTMGWAKKAFSMSVRQRQADIDQRASMEQLYRPPEKISELAETFYFGRSANGGEGGAPGGDVPATPFWADFGRHAAGRQQATGGPVPAPGLPFLTANLTAGGGSFTSSMLALAVLDLPFLPPRGRPAHTVTRQLSSVRLSPAWPLVLYKQAVTTGALSEAAACDPPVLARQSVFDPRQAGASRLAGQQAAEPPPLSGPLQCAKCYGTRASVINLTDDWLALTVLLQVPAGAVALQPLGAPTQTLRVVLEPLRTQAFEAYFYFPSPGRFTMLPAQVSRSFASGPKAAGSSGGNGSTGGAPIGGELLAVARGVTNPVEVLSEEVAEQRAAAAVSWGEGPQEWERLSQRGPLALVLGFLARENLRLLDLRRMCWRMKDRDFFLQTIDLLRGRHWYCHDLWAYSVLHREPSSMAEFLPMCQKLQDALAVPVVESSIFPIAPGAWGAPYEHLEYSPLINARAHSLGGKRAAAANIRNDAFRKHYARFLSVCTRRAQLTHEDLVEGAYYLLLQERVLEAEAVFKRSAQRAPAYRSSDGAGAQYSYLQMQRRYMEAYLDVCSSSPTPSVAAAVAEQYANCRVLEWRGRFLELSNQLAEMVQLHNPTAEAAAAALGGAVAGPGDVGGADEEGDYAMVEAPLGGAAARDAEEVAGGSGQAVAKPPALELKEEGQRLFAIVSHVATVQVDVYVMDIELSFSTTPFVEQQQNVGFAYTAPNWTQALAASGRRLERVEVRLPGEFLAKNIVVEVSARGLRRSIVRYPRAGLWVEVVETLGQLLVLHDVAPAGDAAPPGKAADAAPARASLPGAYVKVFARFKDGATRFQKDGYTDRRGKFDYASTSSPDLKSVVKFSLLVIAEGFGAVVKEAQPPAH